MLRHATIDVLFLKFCFFLRCVKHFLTPKRSFILLQLYAFLIRMLYERNVKPIREKK